MDFNNKENRIVFVGRLSIVQKRIDRLINIWKEVSKEFSDWEFDIIGDGADRNFIENEVDKKSLKRINFHGFKNPVPFLEKAKILLMTSDFEGFGMVLVEAQTYGVVPISFNCFSAIDDIIITNETGIIIDDFKIDKYIEKIIELIQNEKLLNNMAHNSIKSVGKFESSNVANKWMELFHSL
jgi:glycosyltransferase involved in cell wall biosynthesis